MLLACSPPAALILRTRCADVGELRRDLRCRRLVGQIFTRRHANDAVGRFVGNVLVGLSYGWWVDTHNRHHANPNDEERDPDFGESVLALTAGQAAERAAGIKGLLARNQAWLFFPLLTLEGVSLHVDCIIAVKTDRYRSRRGGSRRFEAIGLLIHLVGYVGGLLVVLPNDGLDYLRRQVLTSRNVRGGTFIDFVMGGLNYQIEHHLFPNMPRSALRLAQPIVRAYCAAHDVAYCETSLIGSYRAGLGYLKQVGAPLRAARSGGVA